MCLSSESQNIPNQSYLPVAVVVELVEVVVVEIVVKQSWYTHILTGLSISYLYITYLTWCPIADKTVHFWVYLDSIALGVIKDQSTCILALAHSPSLMHFPRLTTCLSLYIHPKKRNKISAIKWYIYKVVNHHRRRYLLRLSFLFYWLGCTEFQ